MENLDKKISIIKQYKVPIIETLNGFIDSTTSYKENLENFPTLKPEIEADKKISTYIDELYDLGKKYDILRKKIAKDDFNLSLFEINMCVIALAYQKESFLNNIKSLEKGVKIIDSIGKELVGDEFEEIISK